MQLNKQVVRICKNTLKYHECGSKCKLYSQCIIKNKEVSAVNLRDWIKAINVLAIAKLDGEIKNDE